MSVSFIGAGMAASVHAMAAAQIGQPVESFSARTTAAANEKAQQFGGQGLALPLTGEADTYVVCTTPETHATYALPLLRNARRTLIEKPMCTTLDEADQLVASSSTGVYGENLLHAPVITNVIEQSRSMGECNYAEIRLLSPRPQWGEYLHPNRGGGVMFDLGSHGIALALQLLESPIVALSAEFSFGDQEVETQAVMNARCQNGARLRLEASWEHHAQVWDLQLSSSTSVVRAELLPTPSLERNGEPIAYERNTSPAATLYELGYVEQLKKLTDTAAPYPDLAFGRSVLEVLCATYLAAGSGTEVELPFHGPRHLTPLQIWQQARSSA